MFVFIVNPVAGHGPAKRAFTEIQQSKLYQEVEAFIIIQNIPVMLGKSQNKLTQKPIVSLLLAGMVHCMK